MTARLALFDLDGTLVDSQHHILAAMEVAFAALDRPTPPRSAILGAVGLSLPVVFDRLATGCTGAEREKMRVAYMAAYHAERTRAPAPLYPGIAAALADLAKRPGILTGLATGASRRGMEAMIEAHRLDPATAQCADDHPSKPHPSMIRAALAETSVRTDDAVMIGDSVHDMTMARAAGLFALGVGWGYQTPDRLVAAGAQTIAAAPDELVAMLSERWRIHA